MEVRQARQHKKVLQSMIADYLQKSLNMFERETGLSVQAVEIELCDITTASDIEPRHMVAAVRLRTEI